MAAQHHDHLDRQQPAESISQSRQSSRSSRTMAPSAGIPQRLRSEESWVEISSQPSSSSLSSIGEEIVTTGLRVQHDPRTSRRRRAPGTSYLGAETRQAGTSSQEEYEESESESDHVLSSSNEHIPLQASRQEYDACSDSDDDDGENTTALGRRTAAVNPVFTPQPNAFSHPPSSQAAQRPQGSGPYHTSTSQPNRSSPPFHRATSRSHPGRSNQADHDAALRASLTTLLSLGAAAGRGLPKRQPSAPGTNEPMSLRLVPEREIMPPVANSSRPLTPSTRARSSPSISSQEAVLQDHNKRKAKPSAEKAPVKKKRVRLADAGETLVSPTLLTWVMSAGVVVLVSVVGFGAGYVIGWEVGRQEALSGLNGSAVLGDGTTCGREVTRGTGTLRRFRWGTGVARSIVAS